MPTDRITATLAKREEYIARIERQLQIAISERERFEHLLEKAESLIVLHKKAMSMSGICNVEHWLTKAREQLNAD